MIRFKGWWPSGLLLALVISAVGIWYYRHRVNEPKVLCGDYYNGTKTCPWVGPEAGPAAPDPYQHSLVITDAYNATCAGDAEGASCHIIDGVSQDLAGVSWKLTTFTSSSGSLPDPTPDLEGMVCQTGTFGNPQSEFCSAPFPIAIGQMERVRPNDTKVRSQPPPPNSPTGALALIRLELMVGAAHTVSHPKPAKESRAQATYTVTSSTP